MITVHERVTGRGCGLMASPLNDKQTEALQNELSPATTMGELFAELYSALDNCAYRVRCLEGADLEAERTVGRKHLRTTVGELLVHIAEHTHRHQGQAITTAKILMAQRRS
jgi:uncharacterized damage-inducible protein DinB